jgi:dTDP-glucose 4,6-dehydratase
MRIKTIIVTGGAGFIGSNFIFYMKRKHPDVVVNFAAESHVDRSIESPETFLDTNIKGTAVIMDLTGQGIDVFSDCQNIVDNRNGFSRNRYINHMIRGIDTYDDM